MSTNRVTAEATSNTVRGPWQEPVRSSLPALVPQTDPRVEIGDNALVLASTNAFPIVAGRKSRRDNLGLAAGGAVALVLGCATFISLNSGRHAVAPGTAVATATQPQAGLPLAAPAGRPFAAPPAMPIGAQPATVPGAAPAPTTMMQPAMPPASSPVLVYDGSSAPMATVTAGPYTPRTPDGAPALLAGGNPGGMMIADSSSVHA